MEDDKIMIFPKVYIVILNYNGWQDTIECLESVLKNNYTHFQVIVVDNDSPNDSIKYIQSWARGEVFHVLHDDNVLKPLSSPSLSKPVPFKFYTKDEALHVGTSEKNDMLTNELILIQSGENRGFSAGYNVGIAFAMQKNDAEYVMILNNDTVVEKDFLSPLVKKAMEDNACGIVGPKIMHYEYPENIFSNGAYFTPWTSHIKFLHSGQKDKGQCASEVSFLSGAAWFMPLKTIREIGLLDEKYFMYMEDVDYTQQVRHAGKKLCVASKSKIYHKGAQSSGGGNSDFSVYWISKNMARYILNNLTFLQKVSSISYFFYNMLKAVIKATIRGRETKVKIALKGFFEGLSDKSFENEKH